MIFLEIAMLLLGLGAVIYSFYYVEKKRETQPADTEKAVMDDSEISERLQEKIEELDEKAETVFHKTDDKLSELSNEKIMGMSEYSDQVLDKIEKNHTEVVFLYDMLNEKQEEMKKLVNEMDSIKADLHNEAALEYQKLKEQEEVLQGLRKDLELETLQLESIKKENALAFEETDHDDFSNSSDEFHELLGNHEAEMEPVQEETAVQSSVYDAEIARIEEEEAKTQSEDKYKSYKEENEIVNHNDEIISLYKKGRSILEISKMLSMGQGEVKFVIDLYNAR